MRLLSVICCLGLTSTAQAACFGGGTPMFHCTFNGGSKTVDVCLQGDVAVYSFGTTGRSPELLLARQSTGVDMRPWIGVGRFVVEELTFYNNVYSYSLSFAIDRTIENAPLDGSLIVAEGGSEIAEFICDTGSVSEADFYPVFEVKELAGQQFCQDTFSWRASC